MATIPFRRQSKLAKATKAARNLAIADAAWALARDRIAAKLPGVEPRKKGPGVKAFALGAAGVIVAALALLKRDKIAGLLSGGSGDEGDAAGEPAPPGPSPSNYDASGPPANTATPVPAPEPTTSGPLGTVDEQAEIDAAAAEAAAIGGGGAQYAGTEPGEPVDEPQRPLAEAGGGESEGLEQAQADLADRTLQRDAGGDPARERIDEVIDQATNPAAGETPEALRPATEPPEGAERGDDERPTRSVS
jgi:hypothetical protein